MQRLLFAALAGLLLCGSLEAQPALSAKNQAEYVQSEIADAVKAKDYAHVLTLVEQYKHLPVPFVTSYYYTEAFAAYKTGKNAEALSAAANYLNAPDGQEFHADALALYKTLRDQDERKAKAEMNISWTSGVGSGPSIRRGHATADGRTINVVGLTLRCEYWSWRESSDWMAPINDAKLYEGNFGYANGKDIASRFWVRKTSTWTLHVIDSSAGDPGVTYHKAPWEGRYMWSSGDGTWFAFQNRSSPILFWDADVNLGSPTIYYPLRYEPGKYGLHSDYLNANMHFDVDLKTLRVHEQIRPSFSKTLSAGNSAYCFDRQAVGGEACSSFLKGFQSVTDEKEPTCVLLPYRQPADPEPAHP